MHRGPDEKHTPLRQIRRQPTGVREKQEVEGQENSQTTRGLDRLPTLGQQDASFADSPTLAFRAALRGLTPDQAEELATRTTEPLPASGRKGQQRAKDAKDASGTRRQTLYYRLAMVAVALFILSVAGIPMLGMRFGVLAFDLAGHQGNAAMPTNASSGSIAVTATADGSMAGVAQVDTPSPSPTDTATKTTAPIAYQPPAPTATPSPQPTAAPAPVPGGPYSNNTPPPGYQSFAVQDFAGDPWAGAFGQCTWWAHYKRPDENLAGMGNALNWANAAQARGMTVTSTPAPNATAVFAPGVQGASNVGHVSHVEQVLTGGWVLVSEMNFSWNGGGFARVDYRYVQAGPGVWFIH